MGIYLQPKENKLVFLYREGNVLKIPKNWYDIDKKELPVVWIDNGHFDAIAVGYTLLEYISIINPDGRQKKVFLLSIDKIISILEHPQIDKSVLEKVLELRCSTYNYNDEILDYCFILV